MVFRLIEKGTMFNFEFKDKTTDTVVLHKGFLYEPARDIVMFIEGDDLYKYCAAIPQNTPLSVVFHRGQKEFSFDGRYDDVLIKDEHKITEITAMGVINESHRRMTRRFVMTIDVSLYEQRDNADIRAVCTGQSYDVSCDSVSIWSNDNLENMNVVYYMKFVLFLKEHFNLPAKILRKKPAPPSSFFKYEYILLFDFSSDQKEKYRLLDAFIKNSIG